MIDSKQLQPLVRTQYMRTAFQIPFDATVRVSLDTNLVMLKETPEGDVPDFHVTGRWCANALTMLFRLGFMRVVLSVRGPAPAWTPT